VTALTDRDVFAVKPIACMILVLASNAAAASGIGLMQSWQSARDHDPAFAAARAQLEAGHARGSMATALWLPTLAAVGGVGQSTVSGRTQGAYFSAPGVGSTGGVDFQTDVNRGTATRWSIIAEQPLFDRTRKAESTDYSNAARIAEAQYRQAEQDLMLRSARAHFTVLNARALLAALRGLRQSAERTRSEAQARYDAGDIPATDVREAQASADAVGIQELDAKIAVTLAEAAYTDLTGLDPADIGSLPEAATEDLPEVEGLDVWTQRVLGNSPELRISALAIDTASAQVTRYTGLGAARMSLVAQWADDSLSGSGAFGAAQVSSRQQSVAVQVSLPLYTGGMRHAERREARAVEQRAEAELSSASQRVSQQTRSAWLALTSAAARIAALRRLRLSTRGRLDATRLGVEIGGRNTIELLNAEADYRRSGTEFQRAQSDWMMETLQLKALAGELRESDLARLDCRLGVGTAQCR
jgi:outer membrane protein